MQPHVRSGIIRLGKLHHVPPKQIPIIQHMESLSHPSLVLIAVRIIQKHILFYCSGFLFIFYYFSLRDDYLFIY